MESTVDEERPCSRVNPKTTSLNILLPYHEVSAQFLLPIPAAQFLEQLSVIILIRNVEDGTSSNPGYHSLAPLHIAEMPGHGVPGRGKLVLRSRDDFVSRRAQFARSNPDIRMDLVSTTSSLNEAYGRATVYVTCRLSDYRIVDLKSRESVTRLEWKYERDAGWICTRSYFLHGYSY